MNIHLTWTELKESIVDRGSLRFVDRDTFYSLLYLDRTGTCFGCSILKDSGSDQTEFEDDYMGLANVPAKFAIDSDTGGNSYTPRFAPDGWHQQTFETELETSNSGSDSIHEKNWKNEDLGYSSLKFYKLVGGDDVECTDQTDIDTNCIRTDLLWMPPFDFSIKSGWVAQKAVPATNMYVWALGVDLDVEDGGPQKVFAEGGINLTYIDSRTKVGLDGVAGTILYYDHPTLGEGAGTNRLRFVIRHNAGVKHRIQAVLELFVE